MFRDGTQGDSKGSASQNESETLSAFTKLDELQDKIKRNELTALDLSEVRVDDLKAEVKAMKELMGHSKSVYALTMLPGGELASGSYDHTIKLWNVETGKCVRTLSGHSYWVNVLTVLPGGELASGSLDKTIKLWNVKTGECVRTLSVHNDVRALTVLPGGELASGSHDKTIKLWNVETGKCVRTLSGHSDSVFALMILPGGELVSGSYDNTIKLWDVKTGECVLTLSGHSGWVHALTVLPGGMLASGSRDKTIKLWNVETGKCVRTLKGHKSDVCALTVLPGGELASGSFYDTVKLWNVKTGKCARTLSEHSNVRALTVLPGGELVSGSHDGTIKLWNTAALQRRLSWNEVNNLITLLKKNRSLTRLTMRLSLKEMKAPEDAVIKSLVGLVSANTGLVQLDLQKTGISEQGIMRLYESAKQHKPAFVLEHEWMPKILAEAAAKTKPPGQRAVSETAIAITEREDPALRNLLQEFKTSGLSPADLIQLQQTLSTFHTDEVSESVQWIKQCQMQWGAIEAQLATVSELVGTSADAKAEKAEIDGDPALQAYQCRLQQELAKFMTAYWLSTSSIFKLSDNKKGTVLNAIKGLPLVGTFLGIFVVGLQEANDKYRFYQVNRLADLFTDTHMIVQVCQRFSYAMTRAKADEIKAQTVDERVGMKEKAAGFYQDVKKSVMEAAKEWKTTSKTTGVKLQPCEALAMLDGSFLLDQILQGKTRISKTSDPEMMANQFLQVLGIEALSSPTPIQSPTLSVSPRPAVTNIPVVGLAATIPLVPLASESKTQALEAKVQQFDQQLEQVSKNTASMSPEELRTIKEGVKELQGEIQRLQNLPQQVKEVKRQVDELGGSQSSGNQLLATRGQFAEGQALAVDGELQEHHVRLIMVESEAAQQKESLQNIDGQVSSLQAKLSRLEQQQREQVSMKALHDRLERQEKEMKRQQEEQLKAQQTQQAELERLKQELARQETNQSSCSCVVL